MPVERRFRRAVVEYRPCIEFNGERSLPNGKRAGRWVYVELECGHAKVQQENGHRQTKECRICELIAYAPHGWARRAT